MYKRTYEQDKAILYFPGLCSGEALLALFDCPLVAFSGPLLGSGPSAATAVGGAGPMSQLTD